MFHVGLVPGIVGSDHRWTVMFLRTVPSLYEVERVPLCTVSIQQLVPLRSVELGPSVVFERDNKGVILWIATQEFPDYGPPLTAIKSRLDLSLYLLSMWMEVLRPMLSVSFCKEP